MDLEGGGRRMVGIVSRSPDDNLVCDHGGIDTRVDYYLDWIDETLSAPDAGVPTPRRWLGRPGCRGRPGRRLGPPMRAPSKATTPASAPTVMAVVVAAGRQPARAPVCPYSWSACGCWSPVAVVPPEFGDLSARATRGARSWPPIQAGDPGDRPGDWPGDRAPSARPGPGWWSSGASSKI